MHNRSENRRFGFLLMAALVTVSLFVCSCNMGSRTQSIVTRLDQVDSYISIGATRDALNELKQIEKLASSSMDVIGIYKRYMQLSETESAEKLLVKFIKKNGGSPELNAVYTHFLLRQKRVDEAYSVSLNLKDTEYASLWSEALFRYALENKLSAREVFDPPKKKKEKQAITQKERDEFFTDKRFIPAYVAAYNSSKDSIWIFNAACLYLKDGEYSEARKLKPEVFPTVKDGYFWGCVLYDCGRYAESLEAMIVNQSKWKGDAYSVLTIALCADDFYILGQEKTAEQVRKQLVVMEEIPTSSQGGFDRSGRRAWEKILPQIYLNSAIYFRSVDNIADEHERLVFLLHHYPQFVPGLAAYAQMALDQMERPDEGEYEKQLRLAGLRTQEMERYDAIPKVSLEDAVWFIDNAIAQEEASEAEAREKVALLEEADGNSSEVTGRKSRDSAGDPTSEENSVIEEHDRKRHELMVLKEQIYEKTHKDAVAGELTARAWRLLEKNEVGPNRYPAVVLKYALMNLLKGGDTEAAFNMYKLYLKAEHDVELDDVTLENLPDKLSLWEYEMAAWFLHEEHHSEAREIYEFIARRFSERATPASVAGEDDQVVSALMNLAVIYGGTGNYEKALEVLNKAGGRTTNSKVKSEVLFRMAKIEYAQGRTDNALQDLRYAVNLNSGHNKARLLLKELTNGIGK